MNTDYKKQLSKTFQLNDADLEKILVHIYCRKIPSGTVLLSDDEVASKLFIVFQGCLRSYFIKEDGKEFTFEFFIENQIVASFESATEKTPSRMYIEAIEESVVGVISLKTLEKIIASCGSLREEFDSYLVKRLIYYMHRCSSHIIDKPESRYRRLLAENPQLVARIPKQYIASYLGITPVSLSRIRNRLKK